MFPEDEATALAVAHCESGFKMVQSRHQQPYGREMSFGIFQVHSPDWEKVAVKLGYADYKTNPVSNVKLARHIYEQGGWQPWSCFSQRMLVYR